jgi:hypothetical protein
MLCYVMLRAVRCVLYCNGAVRGKNRLTEGTNTFRLYLRPVSPFRKRSKTILQYKYQVPSSPSSFSFSFLIITSPIGISSMFHLKINSDKKKGLSPWMGYHPTTSSLLLQKKSVKKHYMSKNVRCTLFKRSLFYCPETPNL